MGIFSLLEQIENNEIVLPAIQRDFVWSENQIEKLMDSIMRSYPIGIVFLWETYNDIQYRYFEKDFKHNKRITYHYNNERKRFKLVLDGQQRLQALYLGIYGAYEGKYLYFDILSGRDTDDFKEDKFIFDFFVPQNAAKHNEKQFSMYLRELNNNTVHKYEPSFFCKLKDLISMGRKEKEQFELGISEKYKLSDDDKLRLRLNLSILREALTLDTDILRTTVLDENKPRESPDRKSESDVLEAFVRINSEGTRLNRSDLIFSMLKLNWGESATTLPDFVDKINEGNSFELDSDFVIRCLFAVSNLGTEFNIDLLRKQSNIELIKHVFNKCCDSINSTIDFVQNECWIASTKLIKSYNNLVPFVYYLFNIPDHQVPNSEIVKVRKALYLFGYSSPFSRYTSRLNKFIREDLKPLSDKQDKKFPLYKCYEKLLQWDNVIEYNSNLLQKNPSLTLHLLQRRSGINVHYEKNAPQIDHIFPKSSLKNQGYKENEINHFANYWILSKNKNQNKYNNHPQKYFEDVDDAELQRAYIYRELLDFPHYKKFLQQREADILEHIKKELDFNNELDFPLNLDIDDFV